MAAYFASDIHLRPDRPDRGLRFSRWVGGLQSGDELTIVGDLCGFWFASRGHLDQRALQTCPGLTALVKLRRRNVPLTVMTGNHDAWLGPFYESVLHSRVTASPSLDVTVHGLRLHLVHGHLLGGRSWWKRLMETRLFSKSFRLTPSALARSLEDVLEAVNERHREESNRRHLQTFHRYADTLAGFTDIAVFGHVHKPIEDATRNPRLIVLGDWLNGMSYLRIDAARAEFVVDGDGKPVVRAAQE